jgi:NADPH:quinone reductase-like Zn-dependent oxidoreductase
MKAITQDRYGGLKVLEFRDIDQPVPKDNEVLVRCTRRACIGATGMS